MTDEKYSRASDQKGQSLQQVEIFDALLGRLDLAAIIITLLGICVLAAAAAVIAICQLAKLVACLWAYPADRWLIIVLAAALVWILARWKKLCVF